MLTYRICHHPFSHSSFISEILKPIRTFRDCESKVNFQLFRNISALEVMKGKPTNSFLMLEDWL